MEVPQDAAFIYADPEKKNKIVLIADNFSVTAQQFERIKKWFELQFFVTGQTTTATASPSAGDATSPEATPMHVQREPVLVRTPRQVEENPTRPVSDSGDEL